MYVFSNLFRNIFIYLFSNYLIYFNARCIVRAFSIKSEDGKIQSVVTAETDHSQFHIGIDYIWNKFKIGQTATFPIINSQ